MACVPTIFYILPNFHLYFVFIILQTETQIIFISCVYWKLKNLQFLENGLCLHVSHSKLDVIYTVAVYSRFCAVATNLHLVHS